MIKNKFNLYNNYFKYKLIFKYKLTFVIIIIVHIIYYIKIKINNLNITVIIIHTKILSHKN
jgi:hypothetical protein